MFSIVIATCGRPVALRGALLAVLAAFEEEGSAGHEILVVDNSRSGSARDVVEAVVSIHGEPVRYLTSRPFHKSAALNVGIAAAANGWLGFTDDDCLPAPAWLKNAGAGLERLGLRIAGGKVIPSPGGDATAWLRPGRSARVPIGPALVRYEPRPESGMIGPDTQVPLGANIFVKRDVFEECGGYDESLWDRCGRAALGCEDAEFAMRVRARGIPIGFLADSVVEHPVSAERATICHHMRWAHAAGVREAILFRGEPALGSAYAVRRIAGGLVGAVKGIAQADTAAAVCELMGVARLVGCLRGRRVARRVSA